MKHATISIVLAIFAVIAVSKAYQYLDDYKMNLNSIGKKSYSLNFLIIIY